MFKSQMLARWGHMAGESRLVPGETGPQSGIYRAIHHDHRTAHEITVLAGEEFPSCRGCQNAVRFELARAAEHAIHHHDRSGGARNMSQ